MSEGEVEYVSVKLFSIAITPDFPAVFVVPAQIAKEIYTWVHEFTEATVHSIISSMLSPFFGWCYIPVSDGKIKGVQIIHIITSLCTDSLVRDDRLSPDEFWEWLQEVKV